MSHTELATQSQLYAGPGGILCEASAVQTGLMVKEDECQLSESSGVSRVASCASWLSEAPRTGYADAS